MIDVEVKLKVTDHIAEVKRCKCKKKTKASFPSNVLAHVQYGTTVKAISAYLSEQFIAKDRLTKTMKDIFGLAISDTTLLSIESDLANNLEVFCQETAHVLKNAKIKHLDETGIRVNGKTTWLHNLSSKQLSHFKIASRGEVPKDLMGTIVHDHYIPYNKLTNVKHVYCNAHILRELKGIDDIDKHQWSKEMQNLLLASLQKIKQQNIDSVFMENCNKEYDAIIDKALIFYTSSQPLSRKSKTGKVPKRKGHNLALRLKNFKRETLAFMSDPDIPFTNNQAERDLRMTKLKQKISGCFRTKTGGDNFSKIRSFISSLAKNGINILEGIKKALSTPVHLCDFIEIKAKLITI